MTAFLVDDADNFARSGAQVVLTLPSLEIAASEMPWADEDPEGFEVANGVLKERMRSALTNAATIEPARDSSQRLREEQGIALLLDLVGEVDSADFEPLLRSSFAVAIQLQRACATPQSSDRGAFSAPASCCRCVSPPSCAKNCGTLQFHVKLGRSTRRLTRAGF